MKIKVCKIEKCQKLKVFIDVIARILLYVKKIIRRKTFVTIIFNNIIKKTIAYNNEIFLIMISYSKLIIHKVSTLSITFLFMLLIL